MGDPIVISDDSDSECSFDYIFRPPPQAVDPNPGPSRGWVPASEPSATSWMAPMPVLLASGLSPEVSLVSQDVNLAPGTSRPLDVIDLTDNPDVWVPVFEGTAVTPERQARASVAAEGESEYRQLFPGILSTTHSSYSSHSSLDQACGSGLSRHLSSVASLHHAPDVVAISSPSGSSSHLTEVPSALGSFYQELFDDSEEQVSEDQKPEPIPQSRVQRVINTIEANFPEGTVQCLRDSVTPRFYPPREILSHVIRKILLSPEVDTLLDETLKLLTKIQELHPASVTQVEWDWQLLTFVMQEREKELPGQIFFLRYVLQTMEDDFQEALKHPPDKMPATIANAMLSCYKQSCNIRDIIRWLIGTLSGHGFPLVDRFPQIAPDTDKARAPRKNINQITVLYLQKMLALAVEVDGTPTCSSNKIAEMLFASVLNIPERDQREAFFTSMENHLLRCKVLEILMLHGCSKPTTLPLSFAQILYFLNNATSMYHQTEDPKWESWDEFLEHLHFLLISYQQVVTEHLRVPIGERKEKSRRHGPQTHQGDDISAVDIELQIEEFRGRMVRVVGGIMPLQLQEKLFLFKLLFLQAIHGKPLLETRFHGGHIVRAHSLLRQEFPEHT